MTSKLTSVPALGSAVASPTAAAPSVAEIARQMLEEALVRQEIDLDQHASPLDRRWLATQVISGLGRVSELAA